MTLRQEFEDYKRTQEANEKAKQRKAWLRWVGNILASIVVGVISGLIVSYWPRIIMLFH